MGKVSEVNNYLMDELNVKRYRFVTMYRRVSNSCGDPAGMYLLPSRDIAAGQVRAVNRARNSSERWPVTVVDKTPTHPTPRIQTVSNSLIHNVDGMSLTQ
jgi:transposase-like protein